MYEAHAYCCKYGMQLARFETRDEANCFAEKMQGNFIRIKHAREQMEIVLFDLQPVHTVTKYSTVACVCLEQMRTTRIFQFGVLIKHQLM